MKTLPLRLLLMSMLVLVIAAPTAVAQRQLGNKKGPVSKLYVAETKGETEIQNGEKIYTVRQATAFDAPGTVIETKVNSHDTFVYSNGTGLFVDASTRVEINRFTQEPFRANRNNQLDSPYEPSVSQSDVFVTRGIVGICTNQLISGSAMLYNTPFATINIRGGRLVIESNAEETIVDLLEGDLTVRRGAKDVSGQILRAGDRATIRPAGPGLDPVITIEPIPRSALARDDDRTAMACNARKSVTFEAIEKLADAGLEQAGTAGGPPDSEAAGAAAPQEIVARPTVPQNPPTNIVISPDRLPGT